MSTDVRMYYEQGNNPLLFAQKERPRIGVNSQVMSLDRYELFSSERSMMPLREKVVYTPKRGEQSFSTRFNGGEITTRKEIVRTQLGTNNMTQLLDIDFPRDTSVGRYSSAKGKAIHLTRDLADGDVFELVMKQCDDGTGKVLKFATKNGVADDLLTLAKRIKGLDPLANKWIKTAFKYVF